MKKLLVTVLVCGLVIALVGPASISARPDDDTKGLRGTVGQAGKSLNAFIELWEKANFDLPVEEGGWSINSDGAWGKMKYSLAGSVFSFHFNGHGLEPGSEYSLIYYPDPWPGTGLITLGTATANEDGNILIKGTAEIETLPAEGDANEGAKIWLVLAGDVGEGQMAGWTPAEYLFEYDLITFNADDEGLAASNKVKNSNHGKGKTNNPGKGHDKHNSEEE